MSFADHFSAVSAGYAAFRPRYPDALFDLLAEVAPARDAAWDCATGNGQAALGLARHFARCFYHLQHGITVSIAEIDCG